MLLDTHIVLWLDAGDARLRRETVDGIEGHWRAGGTIAVSAVTAWEIALLAESGRIVLDVDPEAWLSRFLARPGLVAAPLTVSAAARAYRLDGLPHRDPADRLLIATAVERGWPLVTYDPRILAYAENDGAGLGLLARTH